MPKTVGARELKTRLGAYMRKVRQGHTLIVTEHGEPVAELRPLDQLKAKGEAGRLEELVALGHLSRTSREPLGSFKPVSKTGPLFSKTIVKSREDRF
jgi:prevent-host-death family protein